MDRAKRLRESWDRNAANWIRAVRGGTIPSRKAGTDRAILDAILRRAPKRLLDVGCGEGWLVRQVADAIACEAIGTDASPGLIAAARAADPGHRYAIASYEDLTAGRDGLGGGFDIVACNYALFEEDIAPLLAALRKRLSATGVLVIQTLHPGAADGGETTPGVWRTEDFAAFEQQDWAPMPWFHRTRNSWEQTLRGSGFQIEETIEPSSGEGAPPLSLLMVCKPS